MEELLQNIYKIIRNLTEFDELLVVLVLIKIFIRIIKLVIIG